MFVTVSTARTEHVTCSDEGSLEWIHSADILEGATRLRVFADIVPIIQHISASDTEGSPGIFTASSLFDGHGELLRIDFR